jgi:uncharacterized membrane protein YdjX (TVP38/TMEM64 family)
LRDIKSGDMSPHSKNYRVMNSDGEKGQRNPIVQLVALMVLLIALFLAMKFLPVQQWMRNFNDWVGQMGNYFYGLTAVKFWPYVLASWIGMMPGAFLYVYIGAAGKAAVSVAVGSEVISRGWQYWTFTSIGLIATIIVTIWATKIVRDALDRTKTVC